MYSKHLKQSYEDCAIATTALPAYYQCLMTPATIKQLVTMYETIISVLIIATLSEIVASSCAFSPSAFDHMYHNLFI
jgi:hypothetical protein